MNTQKLKQILVPTLFEIIICLALAVGLISVIHVNEIVQYISNSSAITPDQLNAGYSEQLENLDNFQILQTVVVMSFWGFIGLVAYVFYLVVSRALTGLRNEVVIGTTFANKGAPRIIPIAIHVLLAILFIGTLWASVKIGLPLWLDLADKLFKSEWLIGFVGMSALVINTYLLWAFFQIVRAFR